MASRITKIIKTVRDCEHLTGAYHFARMLYRRGLDRRAFTYHGSFINRSSGRDKLCIVLAGYKSFLYPAVMGRLEAYMDEDLDVCIVTSGKYSAEIADLCERNQWSYLSTKENNVSLVQNVAIHLHPNADYIFKLDEDMFITEDYFSKMIAAYERAAKSAYHIGVLAPLIPVNGYGNRRILEITGLVTDYELAFEKPMYETGPHKMIENCPMAAQFMWENIDIDDLARIVDQLPKKENPCAIRFSIGAILFKRSLWKEMQYYPVDRHSSSMGEDEGWLNAFCSNKSRPFMVSDNVVVGHFSFGPQNDYMREFYYANKQLFEVKR